MAQWIDQVNNHPLHDVLRRLSSTLDVVSANTQGYQTSTIEQLDRIRQVSAEVTRRIDNADPSLLSVQILNNLNNAFTAIVNELTAFQNNKNQGHVNNAGNHVGNLLVHLASIPVPSTVGDAEALRESITSFRRSVGQHLRGIDEQTSSHAQQLKEFSSKVDAFGQAIDRQSERMEKIITELQERFRMAEDQRQKEFRKAMEDRSLQIMEDNQQRHAEWKASLDAGILEFTNLKANIEDELKQLKDTFMTRNNDFLDDISSLKTKSEELVGIITNTGMISGYQKEANWERKGSTLWKVVAFLSLVGLVGFSVLAFKLTFDDKSAISWPLFGMRAFVALAFGILAAYAALQAERHDKAHRKYRKTELELASIAPFLHDLPEPEQQKMKMDLAQKLFGQGDTVISEPDKKTTGTVLDLVRMALESVASLAKK